MNKYAEEKEFITAAVNEAVEKYIVTPKKILQKSEYDLVTEVDTGIEAFLIKKINSAFPDDIIHSEETLYNSEIKGRTWIIDPIDGTCNMASNIRLFGVQLVLCDDKVPVLSLLQLPYLNETFVAVKGEGAFLNAKKINVSKDVLMCNAILDFGDFSHRNKKMAISQYKAFGELYPVVGKIRMFGSACVTFANVAAGKTHSGIILTRNLWDLVPGLLMAEEAGAIVTNPEGEPYKFGDGGVVASANREIHDIVIKALN